MTSRLISYKTINAIVSAKTKPENLVSGHFVEKQ